MPKVVDLEELLTATAAGKQRPRPLPTSFVALAVVIAPSGSRFTCLRRCAISSRFSPSRSRRPSTSSSARRSMTCSRPSIGRKSRGRTDVGSSILEARIHIMDQTKPVTENRQDSSPAPRTVQQSGRKFALEPAFHEGGAVPLLGDEAEGRSAKPVRRRSPR